MSPYKAYLNNKHTILFSILFLSSILPAILAVENIRISPDSMIYALISQEIISGNGIKLPIIYDLNDNYVFINGAVPYFAQPPLLPILFALLGGVTPQSFLAAQIINVISHAAISIFTFLLIKKLYDNNWVALLTGTLTSISVPLLWNTHHMLSESLFIALTTATLYFLILSRHSDSHQSVRNLFIAGICASAAILTRFPGVALIPVFLWEAFVLVKNKSTRSKCVSTVLAAILPVITSGALLIRNYVVSGTTLGWNPHSPGRSYIDAFTGTVKMIFLQFQLNERTVILLTTIAVFLMLLIFVNTDTRRRLTGYIDAGLDLIIIFIFSYTTLITHAMAKVQPLFELRYVSPLVPFLFMLSILFIVVAWDILRLKGFSKLSLCGIILSLGILTFGNFYKTYVNAKPLFEKQLGHYRILNSPTYHWIKENYGENVIITTNRPFHLSFFGGFLTVRLPHQRYYTNYQIPDNMASFLPSRMSKFGSRLLVLFEKADAQHEGSYIAGLFNNRTDDDNFALIHKFSDGVIYQLKE